MVGNDEKFLKELLETFQVEAREYINRMANSLLQLEQEPDKNVNGEIIETIFRDAHSLKGAARAIELNEIEHICQALEDIFSGLKSNLNSEKINLPTEIFDTLHQALDTIQLFLEYPNTDTSKAEQIVTSLKNLIPIIEKSVNKKIKPKQANNDLLPKGLNIDSESQPYSPQKSEPVEEPKNDLPIQTEEKIKRPKPAGINHISSDTVRISQAKLDSLLLRAEEMVSVKLITFQLAIKLRELKRKFEYMRKQNEQFYNYIINKYSKKNSHHSSESIEIEKSKKFISWKQAYLKKLESQLIDIVRSFEQDRRFVSFLVDNLLEDTKKAIMLPFSWLFETFPKTVREIARSLNKKVKIEITGGEVEIDKRILEEIKDPLIHLIRNAIDHGIESPEVRLQKNKSVEGLIKLSVNQIGGGKVEIRLEDDGAGIDLNKIKKIGIELELIQKEEADKLTPAQILALIFHPTFTTSERVTHISGRGLGMTIVKEKVEKLGGIITIETKKDIGTQFIITLPLTLATYRGILLKVSDRTFVIPTTHVKRVMRIKKTSIKRLKNQKTILIDHKPVSLVDLAHLLQIPRKDTKENEREFIIIMLLEANNKHVAFSIDEVIREQEVLVKPLGKQLARVLFISGATVLGDGTVVPILNAAELLQAAIKGNGEPSYQPEFFDERQKTKKSILVVDDSITTRMLIKNILEVAGYEVQTAVDGIDAMTKLREKAFNLIISDIQMPRMDGFALTKAIREDEKFAQLPVVLVTSLDSREDREKGLAVGASAYIVKQNFNQSGFLNLIEKFV